MYLLSLFFMYITALSRLFVRAVKYCADKNKDRLNTNDIPVRE